MSGSEQVHYVIGREVDNMKTRGYKVRVEADRVTVDIVPRSNLERS